MEKLRRSVLELATVVLACECVCKAKSSRQLIMSMKNVIVEGSFPSRAAFSERYTLHSIKLLC